MKNKKKTIIIALLFLAVCMGVGYSILSKQLKIQGNVNVDPKFDVQITGIEKYDNGGFSASAGFGDVSGLSQEAIEVSAPTFTSTTANFNVRLTSFAKISYLVTVENKGELSAKFDPVDIVKTGNADVVVETPVTVDNKEIGVGDKVEFLVTISYVPFTSSEPADSDSSTFDSSITINLNAKQTNDFVADVNPTLIFNKYSYSDNRFNINILNSIFDKDMFPANSKVYESVNGGEYEEILTTFTENESYYNMTYNGGIVYTPARDLLSGNNTIKLKIKQIVGALTYESNELIMYVFK